MARKPFIPRPPAGSYGTRIPRPAAAKKSAQPQSVRFKMTGHYTVQQYRDMFRDMFNYLEAHGITHLDGCNTYANLSSEHRHHVRLKADDDPIIINGPYPVAAEEYKAP